MGCPRNKYKQKTDQCLKKKTDISFVQKNMLDFEQGEDKSKDIENVLKEIRGTARDGLSFLKVSCKWNLKSFLDISWKANYHDSKEKNYTDVVV